MKHDKAAIAEAIYPYFLDTQSIEAVEALIECARAEAFGWSHTHACLAMDAGKDIRKEEIPDILKQFYTNLINSSEKKEPGRWKLEGKSN